MSDFLFVPLRPFFYAALAKRWKVQFHKGLRKFNNVDSKTTYFNENCCIIYIYIYIIQQFSLKYVVPKIHKLSIIVKQFFTEQGNQLHVYDICDIIILAKDLKIFPAGRPIVSGIGTLTENISGFIDSILQRLMLFIPSYIKDTTEFINKLASIKTISSDVLLVTMDVTSLYTNIPHVDGVDACSKFLNDHCVTDISTDVLCSLISFILTHNNFVFDDHDYLQTSGTAMGTKKAPCFANIFMASIEQTFIDSSPLTPLFYVRFIDDIFMIWTHESEELEQPDPIQLIPL